LVVVLCLSVAYAGRTGRLSDQLGLGMVGSAGLYPSATLNGLAGQPSDALVRPVLADTQAASGQRLQIMHYEAQPGDTVAALADRFDISESTIRWTNSIATDGHLDPGQQVVILPVSGVLYTVQSGDTLDGIAQRFQSDTDSISSVNQLTDPVHPPVGQQIIIPGGRLDSVMRPETSSRSSVRPLPGRDVETSTALPPPAMAPVASPTPLVADIASLIEHNPITRHLVPGSAPAAPPAAPAAPGPLAPIQYTVADGDTLSSIAAKYGVSEDSIAAASGLQGSEDTLSINQKLLIPPVPGAIYVVKDGDTLGAIAEAYQADPQDIIKANVLAEPYVLQVGQTLVIPNGKTPSSSTSTDAAVAAPATQAPAATPVPAAPKSTYTVQEGDTVSSIAQSFGLDMQTVIDLNGLADPYLLQPGQQIVVRGTPHATTASQPAAAAPAPVVAAPVAPARVAVAAAAPAPQPASSSGLGWSIVSVASRYLGYPYVWGGISPSGFDCSGFVYYVYRKAGNPIPRDMWGQLQSGSRVSRANLQPGDIVFFANTDAYGLSHDGIYIGGGRFIHAADYGIGVEVSSLSNAYYAARYYGATRAW
jgi:LysM repeat protein